VRYADVDPAGAPFTDTTFLESFDSSQYSAWGYSALNNSLGENSLGLMLEEIGQPNVPYGFEGIAQNTSARPNPCKPRWKLRRISSVRRGFGGVVLDSPTRTTENRHRERKVRTVLSCASDSLCLLLCWILSSKAGRSGKPKKPNIHDGDLIPRMVDENRLGLRASAIIAVRAGEPARSRCVER